MLRLLKRLLFPVLYISGGGGGGGSGDAAAADEARKSALRDQIDRIYGAKTTMPNPDYTAAVANAQSKGGILGKVAGMATANMVAPTVNDPDAVAAANQEKTDEQSVSDATRGYYTDQLARSFGAAERTNRFNLARSGLQGGSADVDTNAELQTDQNLGATRIDQAARAAAAGLAASREQERLNAISLVNSGAGDSAVISAQRGLADSLANAQSAQRVNLFGDLFTAGANGVADLNQNAALQQQLARYNSSLATFFPTSSTGAGGRITPSS